MKKALCEEFIPMRALIGAERCCVRWTCRVSNLGILPDFYTESPVYAAEAD
jgi:hypothetical protein